MNLLTLVFIYALEVGITGEPQNTVDPVIYVQAEAGIRINDLYLTGCYYFEPIPYENTADNQHYKINLYINTEFGGFGAEYDYSYDDDSGLVTIWGRLQGKGWR